MSDKPQTYATHRRYFPLHHFVVQPLLVLNLIVRIVVFVRTPSKMAGWEVVFAIAIIGVSTAGRMMALRVQTRLIRHEMRMRLREVLPIELQPMIASLSSRQLVELRFAPDDELPELLQRLREGELTQSGDIKRAIRAWQADHLRA